MVLDSVRRREHTLELSAQAQAHHRQRFVEPLVQRRGGRRVVIAEATREVAEQSLRASGIAASVRLAFCRLTSRSTDSRW
jgi:hypothetical protein